MVVRIVSLLALAALGCVASPQAQDPAPAWIAPGFDLHHPSADWLRVDDLDPRETPWASIRDRIGPDWIATRDAAFGGPRWLIGPAIPIAGEGALDEVAAVEAASTLVRQLADGLAIDDVGALAFDHAAPSRSGDGRRLLGVDFRQTHRGYDVRSLREPIRVRVRVDLDARRVSALGSAWVRGLDVAVDRPMPRADAVAAALSFIPGLLPGAYERLDDVRYVLVGRRGDAPFGRLVHEVSVRLTNRPALWRVIVDARNGECLYHVDRLHRVDVVGTVMIGSLDGAAGSPPTASFSLKPGDGVFVQVVGGNRGTVDATGNFRVPHAGSTAVQVTGRFEGEWADVQNQAAANTTFTQSATPGTPASVVLNGTHSTEFRTAEATAYHWVNTVHDFVAKRIPNFTALSRLTTNVNVFFPFGCNAWFDGISINFTRASGGCANMAFADVVAHEWGHAFHQWFAGSITNNAFSEGLSDHLSLYLTGQRVLGRGIQFQRDYSPNQSSCCTQWPPTQYPSPHQGGEIWAGTMMDLRDNLIARRGAATGADRAEQITIAQFTRKPPDMPTGLIETLVQDDNDGDLSNGTPHFAEIVNAADGHALPRPTDPTKASLVAQTAKPPIGTTLSFALHAVRRANAAYVVALSATKQPTPIPGIGTIDLGLPIVPMRIATTDAFGEALFALPVPNVAVLRGTTFHLQAVVAGASPMVSTPWTIAIQ